MSTFPLYNAMPFAGFLAWTTGFVCNQSRGDVYGFFVLKQSGIRITSQFVGKKQTM